MNEKHNHKLLRPVKFKDLRVGDELILKDSSTVSKSSVTYKTNKFVVLRYRDGSEGTCYQSRLEIDYALAPLCWVEGRPVYPGDGPLYYKYNPSWKHNEEGVITSGVRDDELHFHGGIAFPIADATWTKPEPERVPSFQVEGKDVYPGDTVYYYGVDKDSWGCPHTVKENGRVVHQRTGRVAHVGSYDNQEEDFLLKPQLVIGGRLVPMPEREAPAVGTIYYSPHIISPGFYGSYEWSGCQVDNRRLKRGLVHLNKGAAAIHGRGIVNLSNKKD